MEFENETWREITTRISHNARSGKPSRGRRASRKSSARLSNSP